MRDSIVTDSLTRRLILLAALFLCATLPLRAAAPTVRTLDPDDKTRDEWLSLTGESFDFVQVDEHHGESLSLPVNFPQATQAWRGSRESPRRLYRNNRREDGPAIIMERLQYEIHIPPEGLPEGIRVQCRLVLKTKDGHWFETLGERLADNGKWLPATALHPGWNTIRVDLSDNATGMRPRGHRMRWSRYHLSRIVALGFSVQGDKPFQGHCAIDNITTWRVTDDSFPPLAVVDFDDGGGTAERYGRFELTFDINRPLLNPFAQEEIAVDAVFTRPDGATVTVPAFYYQEHIRTKGQDTGPHIEDTYTPVGPGVFKVRFAPRMAGEYSYHLQVQYRSPVKREPETLTTGRRTLQVTDRPHRGFVRIDEKDPRAFAFENGESFFPVGHSFRSPVDGRHVRRILKPHFPKEPVPVDRGLRVYEELLPQMQQSGVNTFEVWMASWWLGIEWTSEWKNYFGIGRYNQEHAWKLDQLLELAETHDQYVHLVIDNHGKASQNLALQRRYRGARRDRRQKGQSDHEWEHSPYNEDNAGDGGWLTYSRDLFTDADAKRFYRDKLRYIAARWGWNSRIFGVEFWSELDLIGHLLGRHREVYATPEVRQWHQEMSAWFNQQDHGQHLLTTHYSGDWRHIDRQMVAQSFIDYIVCDAYHSPKEVFLDTLQKTEDLALQYNKPFLVTEFGGDWSASNREGLDGDFLAGLWWGWMSRSAGVPFYWWFEYIALESGNKESFYRYYAAFSRFIEGEDKRRGPEQRALRSDWPMRVNPPSEVSVLRLGDGQTFYAWVHDHHQIQYLPGNQNQQATHTDMQLLIHKVEPGSYEVEVWDTWTGEAIQSTTEKANPGGQLLIPLPDFRVHTAVKVKPVQATENVNPAAVTPTETVESAGGTPAGVPSAPRGRPEPTVREHR